MYNSITEENIRSIPRVGNIDISRLPQELTKIYAEIISVRNNLSLINQTDGSFLESTNMLRTLANNLETLVVNVPEIESKRAVAFVAATARYLLLQIRDYTDLDASVTEFDRDQIPEAISSMVLFLIGNSPADAAEVSRFAMQASIHDDIASVLMKAIIHLAKGEMQHIVNLTVSQKAYGADDLEQEAIDYLWECLLDGVKDLARELLEPEYVNDNTAFFEKVIQLAVFIPGYRELYNNDSLYAGPYHLAKLLNILSNDLLLRGIVKVPPPIDTDPELWTAFLARIAGERPYLWENHFDAVKTNFLNPGCSAVLTFPTGAGKSTLAELKIASTLLAGKRIIYLVPTHALEDQANSNLLRIFEGLIPENLMEFDLEYTDVEEGQLPKIAVMTPEKCLTLISVNADDFEDVGLVIFDEFHLLHGREEKKDRRSIDAMFCLLRLFAEAPQADYLLISAMVENGPEIARWVASVTGRECVVFDSSWKPTRQLHSCLMYQEKELSELHAFLKKSQKESTNASPGAIVKRALTASPFTFFSLRNKWDSKSSEDYYINSILANKISLSANAQWNLTSNRNEVAAEFAVYFAGQGIKTLVFVDDPKIAKSTSRKISAKLADAPFIVSDLRNRYPQLFEALESELGDIGFSFISSGRTAVHHGNLLPIERRLNEIYFKRPDGINVVVATATLAQGINLPAEVVIMAGDDRFDEDSGYRETIDPQEILNAAGRAGRAGSSAQGMVLLIPGQIVQFKENTLSSKWWELREKVFSNSDQCLVISDPLTGLLDKLATSSQELSAEQKNVIFRLSLVPDTETSINTIFQKSFGRYKAIQANQEQSYDQKVQRLVEIKTEIEGEVMNKDWVRRVSLKMGLEPQFVIQIGNFVDDTGIDVLAEFSLEEIIVLVMNWLCEEQGRIFRFFTGTAIYGQLAKALDIPVTHADQEKIFEKLTAIEPILLAYIQGENYVSIQNLITSRAEDNLDRARNFCLKLVPNISFIFGVIALVIREQTIDNEGSAKDIPYILRALASLIREGLNSEQKLRHKVQYPYLLRTQIHELFL
ncbi:DEAD/DEAH box helicase [Pedobacter roseus]|uniref:DEAD/DEAH box helicase n=1 Tax=Pedobacter roseus TaxID=336820 RepID=A0A7G9QDS8_9SPHI|nr:DEAD/DEAH box helicase [Pedobacter roseus]QNN41503.1 DEAD/DEAH box helicase [Pedobacter roseus]